MKLRIAFLQLLPADSIDDNLILGLEACKEAKNHGADIALFPEMWSVGYQFFHDEEKLREQAISLDSVFLKRYSNLAEGLDMAIAVTFLEKYEPNPRNTELIAMKYDYLDCILEQK